MSGWLLLLRSRSKDSQVFMFISLSMCRQMCLSGYVVCLVYRQQCMLPEFSGMPFTCLCLLFRKVYLSRCGVSLVCRR